MKLMRWVEQHIRVGRKKDKDNQNSQRGSRGSKQKGPRSASVESGSILKLQECDLANTIREQTSSTVDSLLGPLYNPSGTGAETGRQLFNKTPESLCCKEVQAARERSRIKTNPWLLTSLGSPIRSPCCSSSASADSGAWTATSSDRSGASARSGQSSALGVSKDHAGGHVQITTHIGSPDTVAHDWYYAGSGSSTASLAKRSSASSASCSNSGTSGLVGGRSHIGATAFALYQNVLTEDQLLGLAGTSNGDCRPALFRYPSGTRLTSVGSRSVRASGRPESARTHRKSYFSPGYNLDPAELTSSEDEAYSDGYQTESGGSDVITVRRMLREDASLLSQFSQGESGFESQLTTPVSLDEESNSSHSTQAQGSQSVAKGQLRSAREKSQTHTPVRGRRGTSQQHQACGSPLRGLSGAGNILGPDRVDVCSLSLAKKMQRLRNEREALCAKIRDVRSEEHISRQEKLLLHRELLQFKQFLLMRTLENIGSELNLSRGPCQMGSPRPSRGEAGGLGGAAVRGVSPALTHSPPSQRRASTSNAPLQMSPQIARQQPAPRVPPHQSPRLMQSSLCSPLRRGTCPTNVAAAMPLNGHSHVPVSPMVGLGNPRSPRTPRMGRQRCLTTGQVHNQGHLIGPSTIATNLGHSGLPSPSKGACSQLLKSPQLRSSPQGSPHTPRMGPPLYAKPRGVPRTTTIDFKAFSTQPNARRLSEGA
ncbi:uncharacterized protein LOC111246890 isoform X2 [Varroa destructor]|uniref:Uncharacterized protein n=1 Tax=Varroa destructor TaxID=109461 RepID=A0A7M7JJ65_VARDE|nr:uncharacterized protein LOC111246890 isoform X2 [Varroa destructor]